MKFPAYFNVEPYLALLPKRVSPWVGVPKRKSDPSPEPEVTAIGGILSEERRDLRSLREPIHQLFVNWPSDLPGIMKFTQKYGLLSAEHAYRSDDYLGFSFSLQEWKSRQNQLQQLWDMNGERDPQVVSGFSLISDVKPLKVSEDASWPSPLVDIRPAIEVPPEMRWFYRREILNAEIRAGSLYRYMYLLVVFEKLGSLRLCKNPGCATPRFKTGRSDQVYCNSDCAELIAKRRWWAENGNEWRKQRKKLGKSKAKRGKR